MMIICGNDFQIPNNKELNKLVQYCVIIHNNKKLFVDLLILLVHILQDMKIFCYLKSQLTYSNFLSGLSTIHVFFYPTFMPVYNCVCVCVCVYVCERGVGDIIFISLKQIN